MPGLLPTIDPDGLLEYSVVYTDRALNHMSRKFQGVMRDISAVLKEAYGARSAIVVPGSGTFGMEAVARQFATDRHCLVIRNGWFSFRWSQIFEMGRIPKSCTVVKARRARPGAQEPFAPPPVDEVVAAIRAEKPAVVFAPHVETAAGLILPDDYLRAVADATHEGGGLFVLDCIASGAMWVDMRATGVDVLVSAPQKGWSGSPCCAFVMLSELARERIDGTTSTSYAADLKKWLQVMETYEAGSHVYHTTMPTDALARTRDAMLETRARGFAKLRAAAGTDRRRGPRAARAARLQERRRRGLQGAVRGRELHRRPGSGDQQDIPRPRPADRRRRAAAMRRGRRLQVVPHRPLRAGKAWPDRAQRRPPRARAAGDRAREAATPRGGRGLTRVKPVDAAIPNRCSTHRGSPPRCGTGQRRHPPVPRTGCRSAILRTTVRPASRCRSHRGS